MSQIVAPRTPRRDQRSRRGIAGSCQTTSGLCGPIGAPASSVAETIIPAPTVSKVCSSIRMKAPVVRFCSYGSAITGSRVRSRTRPMSLSWSSVGRGGLVERVHVDARLEVLDRRRARAASCA